MGAALAIGADLATSARVSPPTEPIPLDLADETIARSVLALQRESYAVEAALIGSDDIPQLTETLEGLRAAGLDWLGTFDEAGLTGAVSWKIVGDATVDIHRLVVAPRAFRRGIASALLDALDARHPGRPVLVSTGRDNGPARDLYRRRGFTLVRENEAVPGLWIAELERRGSPLRES
jgi:ribosomal protein S18 acetylase RimI-like enzyme